MDFSELILYKSFPCNFSICYGDVNPTTEIGTQHDLRDSLEDVQIFGLQGEMQSQLRDCECVYSLEETDVYN